MWNPSNPSPPKLYDFLSVQDIDDVRELFKDINDDDEGFSYEDIRSLLKKYEIEYTDEAFHNVCLKIDLQRDNIINWSEFISYFIVELQNDDDAKERLSIIPPIPKAANVVSTTLRNTVVRIQLMNDGRYITVGCNAELCFWSAKWKLQISTRAGME